MHFGPSPVWRRHNVFLPDAPRETRETFTARCVHAVLEDTTVHRRRLAGGVDGNGSGGSGGSGLVVVVAVATVVVVVVVPMVMVVEVEVVVAMVVVVAVAMVMVVVVRLWDCGRGGADTDGGGDDRRT